MKEIMLFEKDDMKVRTILYEDGSIGMNAEDTARGFGWVEIAKSGNECIKWSRMNSYLSDFGFENGFPRLKKGDYIPLNVFHILGMKARNEKAQKFKEWIYIEIAKMTGEKILVLHPKRKEIEFLDRLEEALKPFNIQGVRQYSVLNYRIDYYIPNLNIAIEYDENDHKNYSYEQHEGRQEKIEKELGCRFIRVSDENSDEYNIGYVIKGLILINRDF